MGNKSTSWHMSSNKKYLAYVLASRSTELTIIEASFLIIFNFLSLTGNALVCIAVYRNIRLRTTTNLYIIALAVTDLMSATFVMPLAAGVLISGEWVFGSVACELHAIVSQFVIYASSLTMGLTAINRYVRICKTDLQYRRWFSAKRSCILIASVWIFVVCYILIPRFTGLQEFGFSPGYANCALQKQGKTAKLIHYCLVLPLFLFIPMIATIACYMKVAKTIRQHNLNAVSSLQGQRQLSSNLSGHEIKLSKSLFVVVMAFIICWIPFWVIVVLKRFKFVGRLSRSVELLAIFFLYLSNTINPFIYAGMNVQFRREFRRLFCGGDLMENGVRIHLATLTTPRKRVVQEHHLKAVNSRENELEAKTSEARVSDDITIERQLDAFTVD